ncbi:MAG: hypothetical protein CMH13_17035 [Martelella sp.]|uniref:hypothetical protein n=1 Tax=Martelella sp. TaxID=1969699 RepID=UPI000C42DEF9|nr:hypothetical protein [Martelella sp.]MAU22200.1 hypothetical protein [Martelella sp.]
MADTAENNSIKRLTKTAARVYAVLDNFGDGSTDVIERLIPFLEPILAARAGQPLDTAAIAQDVRNAYKWNFNEDIVEVFVPRLEQRGWLVARDSSAANIAYFIAQKNDVSPDQTDSLSDGVLIQFEEIASDFKKFSENLSPLTALPRSVEEFQDILIEWLLYIEAFSEHNLNFSTRTQKDSRGTLRQVVDVPDITTLRDEDKFLCARYVQHALKNNPKVGEVLSRIASIGLLTEVVQDFVKPVSQIERSDLVVYLDAPIAMELLGVSGKSARENIAPIIDELKRIGCQVRIYGLSLQEIKTTLSAVLENTRPTGPTAQAIARGDVLRSFVAEVAGDPETFLSQIGVPTSHRTLEQNPDEIAYFPDSHYQELYSAISFQQNPRAREHDATASTFIMRQRKGRSTRDLFKAGFVLLSKNGLLAQLTRRKCVDLGALGPSSIPPVVHRRVFSTSIWLRTGLGAGNLEIPKRLLLASCEQVLAIRPGVVNSVRQITQQLGDEEKVRQLDLLVSRDRSAQMLMDKTLGVASVPNADNISELFNEMLHPYLEEERRIHESTLKGEQKKARARSARDQEKIKAEAAARKTAEEELQRQRGEDFTALNSLCQDVTSMLKRKQLAKKSFAGCGAIILALITFLPLPGYIEPKWIFRVLGLVATIIMIYLTITGSKLLRLDISNEKAQKELRRHAESRSLARKLERHKAIWTGEKFELAENSIEDHTPHKTLL